MRTVGGLWHRFYPNYNRKLFVNMVLANTAKGDCVLELGAGSGIPPQHFFPLKHYARLYVGIDLDPRVQTNPYLDVGTVADAEELPFPDDYFDVVFSCMVAEHLKNPVRVLEECARVMKSGGHLLVETPSKWYYPMIISRVIPNRFHRHCMRWLGSKRKDEDVFPTFYRFNDERTIRKLMNDAGFSVEITHRSTPPGYLTFSRFSFMLGILYERSVERLFPQLRASLLIVGCKDHLKSRDGKASSRLPMYRVGVRRPASGLPPPPWRT